MKNEHLCELSQKGPRWAKTSIFSIFLNVFKIEENHHIFTPVQLKYKNSHIWMKNEHLCELSQKIPRWAKTSIFSIFLNVFKIEENHHIFTPVQLKYKNSHIWMKNEHLCELSQKGPRWVKTSIFSIF